MLLHQESATNLPELLLLNFCYQPTPSQLAAPLISQLFFILAILNRAAPFFTARLF